MVTRLLILGGTGEARELAGRVAAMAGYRALLSLAGRTAAPLPQGVETRSGGFGGAAGLTAFLRAEAIDALVVATHPFAARIAANAAAAAAATGLPAIVLSRPPWRAMSGDDWRLFPDIDALVAALGRVPRRVFVTIGRQEAGAFEAAPEHRYLLRSIEPIDPQPRLPEAVYLLERGPFDLTREMALMRRHGTEILVTKNSGGDATRAKLDAARALGIAVMMVERPPPSGLPVVETVDAALGWLVHRAPPDDRGA